MKYSDFNVYLDGNKIETKKINPEEVQNTIAAYLRKMDGIAQVITSSSMLEHDFKDPLRKKVQNGFMHKRSGDLVVVLQPGWVEGYKKGTTHGSPYSYDTHVPLIFYGWNIRQGSSAEYVEITDIAPTLSMLLNIQFPNGCTGKPIPFLE